MKRLLIASILIFISTAFAQENVDEYEIMYGLGGSIVLNSHYTTNDLTLSSASGSYSANFDLSNGIAVEGSIIKTKKNAWGLSGVLSLGQQRSVDGGVVAGVAVNNSTLKISSHSISGNALYRWDNLFLPFGLNFNATSISNDPTITSVSGGIGYQIGAGYFINENVAIEYTAIHTSVKINGKSGNTIYNYGNGFLTEAHIGFKYYFK